jgi:hypothetical protein
MDWTLALELLGLFAFKDSMLFPVEARDLAVVVTVTEEESSAHLHAAIHVRAGLEEKRIG